VIDPEQAAFRESLRARTRRPPADESDDEWAPRARREEIKPRVKPGPKPGPSPSASALAARRYRERKRSTEP